MIVLVGPAFLIFLCCHGAGCDPDAFPPGTVTVKEPLSYGYGDHTR